MKYLILIILVIYIIDPGCSSPKPKIPVNNKENIEIVVNPAIDLFSLIHRFVGDNQYTELLLPEYIAEVENYFGHLKNHPTIEFAREYNLQYQINGDAPMALAVYIGPPPALEPRLDLSNLPSAFDPRWDSTLISNYLINARKFALESNFMEFHNNQKDFHDMAIANLRKMIGKEQIFEWYYNFFGYYPENFKMYLALLNGSCSYGYPVFYPEGETEFVSLIGARFPDNQGFPTYPKNWFLPIMIHEYTHSYINPLIKSKPEEYKDLGEALLVTHRAKMIENGYNVWNVIIQEYLVRACTIHFLEQNEGKRKAQQNIRYDIESGFTEIEGLVKLLDEYKENRNTYLNIESFLPKIKKYFENYIKQVNSKNN